MAHRLPLADIQFIADFAAFCRTKGDEEYNPGRVAECALAQFGHPRVASAWDLREAGIPVAAYTQAVGYDHDGGPGHCGPYTFSALADRLEALIADAPAVAKATV